MLKTSKEIAVVALTVALLIAGQFALSAVQGVEVVTVIFFSFCYVFGVKRGVIAAVAYALLRNIYFGFFPQESGLQNVALRRILPVSILTKGSMTCPLRRSITTAASAPVSAK